MIADRRITRELGLRSVCISPTKPKRPLPYSQFYLTAMVAACKDTSESVDGLQSADYGEHKDSEVGEVS
jgi:hypothetical protein